VYYLGLQRTGTGSSGGRRGIGRVTAGAGIQRSDKRERAWVGDYSPLRAMCTIPSSRGGTQDFEHVTPIERELVKKQHPAIGESREMLQGKVGSKGVHGPSTFRFLLIACDRFWHPQVRAAS
jgi:hypothetical protein